jgi:hypothetical protein
MMILKTSRSNLSSNDQLSLDLPFAATKSLTARVGPTPTFTRGSGATYIGSDGLIHGVDTSTTSNSISAASKTFTLAATAGQDQLWRTGDAVEASSGANIMTGTVTSYNATTQSLVCNMTTASGTGTFTSWRIGYRGPRFDHNPTSPFACRGLLIEEGRTNFLLRSEEFDNAYWTPLRASVPTPNTAISPSGSLNADKLVEDTSSNTHMVYRLVNVGVTTPVSFSVFAKASERSWIQLECGDNFTAGSTAYFNLSNGTIGTVGANATASIQSMGNGWYRCVVVATPTAIANSGFYVNIATANGTRSYAGDGTSGVFLWGAQVEAGSFPTSYIPTTTAPLARSADVCNITGANFTSFYNQSEGTMLTNAFTPASGDRTVLAADDNTANEMIRLRTEGTNPFFKVTDGGSDVVAIDAGTVTANTAFKLIGAYKVNDFASSINGGSAVTDTTGTIPIVDRMRIGAGQGGNTMCGCISAIRYFKKRLPDAKLQSLTT